MLCKSPELAAQFQATHPELRRLILDLDMQLGEWKLAPLTVTCVLRSLDEQEAIYWPMLHRDGFSEADAKLKARSKFSWHMANCAVDFRGATYSEQDRQRIKAWLNARGCLKPNWECLEHDVGRGEHFHVARCDSAWRHAYEANQKLPGQS